MFFEDEIFVFLIIIVVIILIAIWAKATNYDRNSQKMRKEYENNKSDIESRALEVAKKGFNIRDSIIIGHRYQWLFASDPTRRKIFLIAPGETQVLDYSNIISVSLYDETGMVYEKSMTRVVGGAVIGSFFGRASAGAVIGAYTSPTKANKVHSVITIKALLRDCSVPSLTIPCFDASSMSGSATVKEDDPVYADMSAKAERILDMLNVIIDTARRDERKALGGKAQNPSLISEEIYKLAQLRAQGILTEGEFAAAKARLIKGSNDRQEIE